MTIKEIANEHIKVGKTSITVKNNETGKTKGLVKDICTFKSLQPNKQTKFWGAIKKAGIWGKAGLVDRVIIDGNDIFFLDDIKKHEFFKRYLENSAGFEADQENYRAYCKMLETAVTYGIGIIKCYID